MPTKHEPLVKRLYFQVLVGIVAGVLLGWLQPEWGVAMRPLGDGFIKLIRMVIGPIIFGTVVVGIAKMGHMKDVGRLGMKALIYFEVVSTIALILGMTFVNLIKPGAGVNADASALDPRVAAFTASAAKLTTIDFLMNIIPTTVVDAFATGNVLQVLFFSILFGMSLLYLGEKGRPFVGVIDDFTHGMFGVVGMIMWVASIGSFGAMAFVIGEYGIGTIVALGKLLMALFVTCAVFIGVVLGGISAWAGVNLWRLAKYIKEEILIVAGTASGEAVFPRLMAKLEHLGCSKSVVGLVIPTGYSFNLDGTSIYMSMAAIFIAQATNTDLTMGQQFGILAVLLLTSKGSAGVAGAGFVALAATVSTIPVLPVAGLGLLLGIDPFLSRVRAPTNLIGNTLATIVIAKWEGALDSRRMNRILAGETPDEADEPEKVLVAETHAMGGQR